MYDFNGDLNKHTFDIFEHFAVYSVTGIFEPHERLLASVGAVRVGASLPSCQEEMAEENIRIKTNRCDEYGRSYTQCSDCNRPGIQALWKHDREKPHKSDLSREAVWRISQI